MKTIWKFPLHITDELDVEMPGGAELLFVAGQGQILSVWAKVDPESVPKTRHLYIRGTGQPLPEWHENGFNARAVTYVGSAQIDVFVWHVFDGGEIA